MSNLKNRAEERRHESETEQDHGAEDGQRQRGTAGHVGQMHFREMDEYARQDVHAVGQHDQLQSGFEAVKKREERVDEKALQPENSLQNVCAWSDEVVVLGEEIFDDETAAGAFSGIDVVLGIDVMGEMLGSDSDDFFIVLAAVEHVQICNQL